MSYHQTFWLIAYYKSCRMHQQRKNFVWRLMVKLLCCTELHISQTQSRAQMMSISNCNLLIPFTIKHRPTQPVLSDSPCLQAFLVWWLHLHLVCSWKAQHRIVRSLLQMTWLQAVLITTELKCLQHLRLQWQQVLLAQHGHGSRL